jgi:hypothetical protein
MQRAPICRLTFHEVVSFIVGEGIYAKSGKGIKAFSALTAPAVHKVVKICSLKKKIQGQTPADAAPTLFRGPEGKLTPHL